MTRTGVIVYGPPASGKDAVTAALGRLDSQYVYFRRLKVGGTTEGYRPATPAELADLRAAGQVVYENDRYGSTYVVDAPLLESVLAAGHTPVVHIGQIAGVEAVCRWPARWVTVLLWCSRETTARRAACRGSTDVEARLAVWDETAADLLTADDGLFTGRIDTDATTPAVAADLIHGWVQHALTKADRT
jgi:guanylate kinase